MLVIIVLSYVYYIFFCVIEMFFKQTYTFMDIYKCPL